MNQTCTFIRLFTVFCLTFILAACEARDEFSYSDGSTGNYAQFAGKWLLVNYWAEWCKPCIKEFPELNAFAAKHKNVNMIGVNYDMMTIEKEQAIIKKLDIRIPVARAHIDQHYGYQVPQSLPTTIVINPQGTIHTILQGPQTQETLTKAISK